MHLEGIIHCIEIINPDEKIGFSQVCELRPKWCVSAGTSGIRAVCVCTIHQNIVLLLHAAGTE